MNTDVTDGYARPLECAELTERYEAQPRLTKMINTDDLEALDELCLRGSELVQEQTIGSPVALSKELIRDLAICLGEVIMRYIRADWLIEVQPTTDYKYADQAWILVFYTSDGYRSVPLHDYVARRFFGDIDTNFAALLDAVIVMAKQFPGLYLGGYNNHQGGSP